MVDRLKGGKIEQSRVGRTLSMEVEDGGVREWVDEGGGSAMSRSDSRILVCQVMQRAS